jgi:hypothetical protein
MTEKTYPPLLLVEWIDVTNISEWTNLADIPEFAKDGGYICRNAGYLVYEDDDCIVLAARVALLAEPEQVGLFERIPKSVIRRRGELHLASSLEHLWTAGGPR